MDDRAAYRDAALKVAVVVATGAVGWFTTADGNLGYDQWQRVMELPERDV